jgi:pimeloyl-ACP methyl ester carboxylesterase
MPLPPVLISLLALLPLLAAEAEAPAALPDPGQETAVSLLAVDRYRLLGSLHRPSDLAEDAALPAVIVVHPIAHDREDGDLLISSLLEHDLAVLSMDLRGHGRSIETPDHRVLGPSVIKPEDIRKMVTDQHLMVEYLVRQEGIDGERIAIVGTGLSALIAAEAAGGDPRIGAVVLIGPSGSFFGLSGDEGLEALGERPAWIGTSSTNKSWLASAEDLAGHGSGERTLATYEANLARTSMLLDLPELTGDLAAWLAGHLAGERP